MSCKTNDCIEYFDANLIRPAKYLTGVDENGCKVYVDPATIGNDDFCNLLSKVIGNPIVSTYGTVFIGADCKKYTLPPETPFEAIDSSTIDFTHSGPYGHTLTGVVKVSPDNGNQIEVRSNGLYVKKGAGVTVTDSATVDLTESSGDITATVKPKPASGIINTVDGVSFSACDIPLSSALFAPASASFVACDGSGNTTRYSVLQFETPINVTDTNTVDLTATGPANHNLEAAVKFSSNVGNQASGVSDGVFVPKGAGLEVTDTSSVDLTLVSGNLSATVLAKPSSGIVVTPNGVGFEACNIATGGVASPSTSFVGCNGTGTQRFTLPQEVDFSVSGFSTNDFVASNNGTNGHTPNVAIKLNPSSPLAITSTANGLSVAAPPSPASACSQLQSTPVSGVLSTNDIVLVVDGVSCVRKTVPAAPSFSETPVTTTNAGILVGGTNGHQLTANRDTISGGGNNILQITGNGFYVPPPGAFSETSVTTTNTALSVGGTNGHQLTVVRDTVSGSGNNALQITANGLYVPPSAGPGPTYTASSGVKLVGTDFQADLQKCSGAFVPATDKIQTCCDNIGNFVIQNGSFPNGAPSYSNKNIAVGTLITPLAGSFTITNPSSCRQLYYNIEPHEISAIDMYSQVPTTRSLGAVQLEISTDGGASWQVHATNVVNNTNRNPVDGPGIAGYTHLLYEADQWSINKIGVISGASSATINWRIKIVVVDGLLANADIWTPMFTITGIQA